jgi:hypothetical protein
MIIAWLAAAALATASAVPPQPVATRCAMSAEDRGWIINALTASRQVMEKRLGLPADAPPTIILFDDRCRFEARPAALLRWAAAPHAGKIRIPDGNQIDAGVTSFASRVGESGDASS